MYETLIRPYDVHHIPKPISIEEVVEKVKNHEIKKEERRLKQVVASELKRDNKKRKRDEDPDFIDDELDVFESTEQTSNILEFGTDVPSSPSKSHLEVGKSAPKDSFPAAKPFPEVRGHTS